MWQQTIIMGNVGRDAELSYTPQGFAVAKFTVAVSKVTGKGESKKEKTTWFRVTLWRDQAENLSQYIKKGNKIMILGEIGASAYINKQGQPQASLELTAYQVKFLQSKPAGVGSEAPPEDESYADGIGPDGIDAAGAGADIPF